MERKRERERERERKRETERQTRGWISTYKHTCTLLRNPLSTWAALTERERGMRMVFSRITEAENRNSGKGSGRLTNHKYLGRGSLLYFGRACHGHLCQTVTSQPAFHTKAHPMPTSPQRNLCVCVCVCE